MRLGTWAVRAVGALILALGVPTVEGQVGATSERVATQAEDGSATKGLRPDEALWRHRHRGRALLATTGRADEAVAEFRRAIALVSPAAGLPNLEDRIGLGLARVASGDLAGAEELVETIRDLGGGVPAAGLVPLEVVLARAHRRSGDVRRAETRYRNALSQGVESPRIHFELAELLVTTQAEVARDHYRRAAELAPDWADPRWRLADLHRIAGRVEAADREQAKAVELASRPAAVEPPDPGSWQPAPDPRQLVEPPQRMPDFQAVVVDQGFDAASAQLTLVDLDGDGGRDLLVTSELRSAVFGDALEPRPEAMAELEGLAIHGVALGDGNGDDLPDLLWFDLFGVPRLARNTGGRFEPLDLELPRGPYWNATWGDADGDGDADLALLGPRSALLLNEGAAGFVERLARVPFVSGRAQAGAWRDAGLRGGLVVEGFQSPGPDSVQPVLRDLAVVHAARRGVLYRGVGGGRYDAELLLRVPLALDAVVARDVDHDGRTDFTVANASMAVVFLDDGAGGLRRADSAAGGGRPVVWADLTGRGVAELLAGGAIHPNLGLGRLGAPVRPTSWPDGILVAVVADLLGPDGPDGRPDVATVDTSGRLVVSRNLGAPGSSRVPQWLTVELRGPSTLGAVIEVMAGSRYQKQSFGGGGVPLEFGLGGHRRADVVRVTWPDGTLEHRLDVASGSSLVLERRAQTP